MVSSKLKAHPRLFVLVLSMVDVKDVCGGLMSERLLHVWQSSILFPDFAFELIYFIVGVSWQSLHIQALCLLGQRLGEEK